MTHESYLPNKGTIPSTFFYLLVTTNTHGDITSSYFVWSANVRAGLNIQHQQCYATCRFNKQLVKLVKISRPEQPFSQGYQHCVLKSGNFAKCLTYALPQAISLPRHRRV